MAVTDLATKLANIGAVVSQGAHGWTFRTGAPQDGDYLRVTIQRDQYGAEDSHQLVITTQRTMKHLIDPEDPVNCDLCGSETRHQFVICDTCATDAEKARTNAVIVSDA